MRQSFRLLAGILLLALALSLVSFAGATFPDTARDVITVPAPEPGTGPSDRVEVTAFLDRLMPEHLARYNVPGASIVVVKNGEILVAKGYGYADSANKTPVDADTTLFRVGSVTKLFTWTAVMQLADEGKVDLDSDVNRYLKDFRIPNTYPGRPVTLRHLLTHTAGFEDLNRHQIAAAPGDLYPVRDYCRDTMPARVRPPGEVTSYSNYGATLAGVIVEDVSGMSYEQYVQSHIFSPLAMNHSSAGAMLPPELAANVSQGFLYSDGRNTPAPDVICEVRPAGAIVSTAPDIAKFLSAHMNGGMYRNATILSGSAARTMHARAFSNDPRVSGMCLGFYEMQINGRRLIGHDGDTMLFHSRISYLPVEQAGIFVSYNSPFGSAARDDLLLEFMDHYYPGEHATIPRPDPTKAVGNLKYAGTYKMNRHAYSNFETYLSMIPAFESKVSATPNGTLLITSDGQATEYTETDPGVFTRLDGVRSVDGDFVFHTVADGQVVYASYRNMPFLVFDRVPWYATLGFLESVKIIAGAVLATVLLWPALFALRKARRHDPGELPLPAKIARWIAGGASLVLITFVFVLVPRAAETYTGAYMNDLAVPPVLAMVLTIPVISLVLSAVAVVLAIV
ncbi:MAG TPA: serine hydrolase domain-containing protein, partial [Methanoregula sp.]|nr:serine hydrolase domain-containing protein [Methanoregula sp.]